jgi:hypothetical protein
MVLAIKIAGHEVADNQNMNVKERFLFLLKKFNQRTINSCSLEMA